MARKIRNYQTTEDVKNMINEYFETNGKEVIRYLLDYTGFATTNDLFNYENRNYGYGLDCGWVWVKTYNDKQLREWTLDNGKYDNFVRGITCPYETQSTTVKKIQIDKALRELALDSEYYSYVRLD